MTDQKETARQIAMDARVLTTCKACGVITQASEVATTEAYKHANTEYSRGLYHDIFPDRRVMTDAVKAVIEAADKTCACAVTPAKPAAPIVTKPAAPALPAMRSATPRDAALESLPPEMREALLRKASDLGVHGTDDVVWALAASVIDATLAAQIAGQHVQTLTTETGKIPTLIYQGAVKASADIKGAMETAIAGTIKTSLDAAVQTGAATLRQAAADLPKVGQEHQDVIVGEWKAALATAARTQAFAGFFQKLSVSVLLAAILVGGIFIGGVFAGGRGMVYVMMAKHRLTPSGWQLEVGSNGKPLCGALAGRDVCLARHVRKPGA